MIDVAQVDEIAVGGGDCKDEMFERSLFKNFNKAIGYLSPKARLSFTQLRKAITKAPILWHCNLEYYIWIEIDASNYTISGLLSQLTNLGQ